MQADVGRLLLYLVCGVKHKNWRSIQYSSVDWCKRLCGVCCCSWYVVVSISISIGKVYDVAVSIGASRCGVFVVEFGMLR